MYQTKKHKNRNHKTLLQQCWTNRTQFAVPIILLCALGILCLAIISQREKLNPDLSDYQEAPDDCSGEFSDGSYTYQDPDQEILDRYASFAE